MSFQENGGNMPVSYRIDRDRRMVVTTWSGVITEKEILAYQGQLMNDPDFDANFSQYSDLTDVREVEVNAIGTLITAILAARGSESSLSQILVKS
jgi:hypothetical protein